MNRIPRLRRPFLFPLLVAPLVFGSGNWPVFSQAADNTTPAAAQPEKPPDQFANCTLCHGQDARGSDRAPSLVNSAELRAMSDADIANIIRKGKNGMPPFSLPAADIDVLVRYIRALNRAGSEIGVADDSQAGERIFFGAGQCSTCHMAGGRGMANGPDLSDAGRRLRPEELTKSLTDPDARITSGWAAVTVTMDNGSTLHGFERARGSHDLVLQTADAKLHLLVDREYKEIIPDEHSPMPVFKGAPAELHDLVAYLSSLKGPGVGPLTAPQPAPTQVQMTEILHPKKGDWPNYNGTPDGNRDSSLDDITTRNVSKLELQWICPLPFPGLETTPVVVDGVMYVTANNQVYALSGLTGREIWRYQRPKSQTSVISSDAAIGVNRGVATLGDRVFYLTDDAHLLALNRLTGALLWDVSVREGPGRFGGTAAPLVVGDLVITGVGGGDDGIRGFVAAYKAATGTLAWRLWTVPKPGDTDLVATTWQGTALALGGGATWTTGSFDTKSDVLYWPVGNPHPDTDGDQRLGGNLYTNSDLAIDVKTGKILWYYQFTPHDLHDWDANEPIVLVNADWKGKNRKLLLHANRNGFFYVLDRTNGKPLLATKLVSRLTWASGIDTKTWTPILLPANETNAQGSITCPAVRGATNWYSTAYNPSTRLYYVMTVEDCGIYVKSEEGGFRRYNNPAEPAQKILRAINIETGKPAWQIALPGPAQSNYAGVLTTAGSLVFLGESSGGFAAVDARTGKYLWHFETNHAIKGSPMTYAIGGRQFVAIASGPNILSFALPGQ